MTEQIHVFEKAGLGKAPFRLVRVQNIRYSPTPGISMVGGSCMYCGTGIVQHCFLRDANGKEFHVGNECVRKTGDRGLINVVDREVKRLAKLARHAKEAEKIKMVQETLTEQSTRDFLESRPHPYNFAGKTFLDYAEWMMHHAGNSGKIKVGKLIAMELAKA